MTVYCYGRFRIPHKGHAKLFDKSDVILASQSPSLLHMTLLSAYADKPVQAIQTGTLTRWLTEHSICSEDSVVLGEDNAKLAEAVRSLGYSVELVPRDCLSSSTACRRELIAHGGDIKAISYMQPSLQHAEIAKRLWQEGY